VPGHASQGAPRTQNQLALNRKSQAAQYLWGPCYDQQADAGRHRSRNLQEITVSHKTITAGFIGKINRAVARIRNSRRFLKDRRRQGENLGDALRDLRRMLALGFI
jgi:hypothetical protein